MTEDSCRKKPNLTDPGKSEKQSNQVPYKEPAEDSKFYGLESHFNEDVVFYKDVRIHGELKANFSFLKNISLTAKSLHVLGNSIFDGDSYFENINAGIVTVRDGLNVGCGGTTLNAVVSTGNVGIGSTIPQQRVDVAGSIKIDENIYDSVNRPGKNGYDLVRDQKGLRWIPQVAESNLGPCDSSSIGIATDGIFILSGGVPLYPEYVPLKTCEFGNIRLNGTIYDGSNQPGTTGQILAKNSLGSLTWINQGSISAGAGGAYRSIQFHNSTDTLGGATDFVYDEVNLRVGIGTTNPSVTLDINSNFYNTVGYGEQFHVSNGKPGSVLGDGTSPFGYFFAGYDTKVNRARIGGYNYNTGQYAHLIINEGGSGGYGNVGIGITQPNEKLHVQGGIRASGTLITGSPNSIAIDYSSAWGNTTRIVSYGPTTGSSYIPIAFLTANSNASSVTERLRITETGNVGVGSTSPQVALTIRTTHAQATSTTYTGAFLIHDENNNVAPHLGAGVAYASGAQHSWIQSNGTAGVYPLSLQPAGGNVGVGTINPTYKLQVLGSAGAGYFNFQAGNDASGYGRFANSAGTTLGFLGNGGGGALTAGANTDLVLRAEANLLFASGGNTQRLILTNTGNLGVGTINPQFQLQTTGAALINNQYLIDNFIGYFNDPGSYPEYILLGRINSSDAFRIIGNIYGFRGYYGERNTFFNICCSKTNYPASSYTVGNKIGSVSFSLVTLTYGANNWLALQSSDPVNSGGLNLYFTGQMYHSYSSTQWTHKDFYGQYDSIPSANVSNVIVISSI